MAAAATPKTTGVISANPAEFEGFLERERRKWGEIARKSGARVE